MPVQRFSVDSKIVEYLNKLSLNKKLLMIQVFCVILPLFITDFLLVSSIISAVKSESVQEMNATAESVAYTVNTNLTRSVELINNIYSNRFVNEFIETDFSDSLDYYQKYLEFIEDSLFETSMGRHPSSVVLYCDNPSMNNGGLFHRVEEVENKEWYKAVFANDYEYTLYAEYEDKGYKAKRNLSLSHRMDYYHRGTGKSVVHLVLDYDAMLRSIVSAHYSSLVYVCLGDMVLFSNDGHGGTSAPFATIQKKIINQSAIHKVYDYHSASYDVYVVSEQNVVISSIKDNYKFFLVILLFNIFIPYAIMQFINKSFCQRIEKMQQIITDDFNQTSKLELLPDVSGNDEITGLMKSYNKMVQRMNEMIETEYVNKLKQQEVNLARQKAELLALYSQINPHFLFNALESIRMHSVLKQEYETADMVEKLALMERQNVEWGNDTVKIEKELSFIEAYLELQKYRFGDKLNYQIEVAENCDSFRVPKLALVTFVENACVHGMESKTSAGWIFVRIFIEENNLVMEIEDTGNGMSEERVKLLNQQMNDVTIEMLQENKSIGILNAALRLKMFYEDQIEFDLESEEGSGALITISVPVAVAELMKGLI